MEPPHTEDRVQVAPGRVGFEPAAAGGALPRSGIYGLCMGPGISLGNRTFETHKYGLRCL